MTPAIVQLHHLYRQLTGLQITLDFSRENTWGYWCAKGWTAEDLRLVVAHIKNEIRAQRRFPASLRFSNLVGQVDRFEEDLAEARARSRGSRVDPARASVLRATGRPGAPPPPSARPASQIIHQITTNPEAQAKALADLKAFKDSL
jgi:hypothetical protein